jgi:eukaryotic-like serine/threonine-protein kinase
MKGDPGESVRREARLDEAVAQYLDAVEAGRAPNRDQFLARYPDLADDLAEFLDDRAQFQRLVPAVAAPPACPGLPGPVVIEVGTGDKPRGNWGGPATPDPAVADPFPVGHRIGRIELTAVIGRGAFGTVYKGWDPGMNRYVAVKALRKEFLAVDGNQARFLREAKVAAQLDHPGVVRVHDFGLAEGVPYLVSEFVPGRTLAGLIRDDRPTPARAAALVAAVADALEHAHRKEVVHRDVKPSNILLKDDQMPLLTDFGLARWGAAEATLTEDGRIIGTLAYMGPEQARGQPLVDGRSDLYSLGVILYELLTGERPFVGNVRGMLHQIEHDEPRPPRALDDRVPRDLETVCLKCLEKRPDDRYATAQTLADDLRRFLDGKPVRVRPVGPLERLGRWGRRNPALAATGGLVVVLLVATAMVSLAWAFHADRQSRAIRQALDVSRRVICESRLDQALVEADRGDVGASLLLMAWGLETAPAGADDLAWTLRANLNAWRGRHLALKGCLPAPPGEILGFSPDGAAAWAVDTDGRTVRRWDLASGQADGPALEHPAPVSALAVSPDGRRVSTSCKVPGQPVRLWDVQTGKPERLVRTKELVHGLAFSPDGQRFLTEARESDAQGSAFTALQAWDAATGKSLGPAFRQPGWLTAMAFGGDSLTLFTATVQGQVVRHTETPAGRLQESVLLHPVPVRSLAVSPDGRYLLTGGTDRLARLYEVGSDRPVAVLRHRTPLSAVAFGPAGRGLRTASPGDAVRSWEGTEQFQASPPERHPAKVRAVAVSPDGQRVATGADDRFVRLWELADGKLRLLGALPQHPSPVATVAFSPGGNLLATSTHQHKGAFLWDAATRGQQGVLGHPAVVWKVAFSPTDDLVATAGYDRGVWIWTTTGQPVAGPLVHGGLVTAVAFSPDGRTLLTGSADGAVRRWDVTTGVSRGQPLWHGAGVPVRAIVFSPTGRTLVTAGEDGPARQWDAESGAAVGPLLQPVFQVWAVAFSPDGRTILTGGRDNLVRMWDADTGRLRPPLLRHAGPVRVVAVGPTGRWAVTASEDGTARLWALSNGRQLGPPLRHEAEVHGAVLAPGGLWVVTGGLDRTARVWAAPAALEDPPDRLALWAQVVTGAELDEAGGVQALDPVAWRERRLRLEGLGDAPPP